MKQDILHIDRRFRLIEELGRALHRFGLPSHRVEAALALVARRIGVDAQLFATPTAIFASVREGDEQRAMLLRVEPGEIQLSKLGRVDRLVAELVDDRIDIDAARARLHQIVDDEEPHGWRTTLVARALASGSAAIFFSGGWRESLLAALISVVVGGMWLLATRLRRETFGLESLAAVLTGFLAATVASMNSSVSFFITTLAALIILFPGLTLTLGISELAMRNLASGTVRLGGAMLSFVQIALGVVVGVRLSEALWGAVPTAEPLSVSIAWIPVALVMTAAAFVIFFQGEWRSYGWTLLSAIVAYGTTRLAASMGGAEAGAFVGAAALGSASHLYARWLRRPAAQFLIPGVMLIVPGSLGFRSITTLIGQDVVGGVQLAASVAAVAVSLVSGLLVPSRRSF